MNIERVDKILENSLVKVRYLLNDLEKIKKELKTLQGGNKDGKEVQANK